MPVESATYIGDLNKEYPLQDDSVSEGDDHLRITKGALQNTFPGSSGSGYNKAILASEDELNFSVGVAAPIQDQFDVIPSYYVAKDSGDQEIKAQLSIHEQLTILADGGAAFDGLAIYDPLHAIKLALTWDEVEDVVYLLQWGTDSSNADTALKLKDGKVEIFSPSGSSIVPTLPQHLTTKAYVDSKSFAAFSASTGASGTFVDNTGKTITVTNGLITDLG